MFPYSTSLLHHCPLEQILGKGKPPDLEAYCRQASEQEASESSFVFHLPKYTFRFYHSSNRQGISFFTSQLFSRLLLITEILHVYPDFPIPFCLFAGCSLMCRPANHVPGSLVPDDRLYIPKFLNAAAQLQRIWMNNTEFYSFTW